MRTIALEFLLFGTMACALASARLQAAPASAAGLQLPSPTDSTDTTLTGVVTATPWPTSTPLPVYFCSELHGQVLDESFESAVIEGYEPYLIYLPPCYKQINRRYPYVILLHGSGSDETLWTDVLGINTVLDKGIDNGTLPPMILVMPYGGILQDTNVFTKGESFESLVVDELIPAVEQRYCVWDEQAGRALAGISRGGFWVFEIGFRHPDLFGALAGHSAYFDPSNAPPTYNPLNLAQTVIFGAGTVPRLWLDVGSADDSLQNIAIFVQTLEKRGIDPDFTVNPNGEHMPVYWAAHLNDYLAFYGKDWPLNPLTLPSCTP